MLSAAKCCKLTDCENANPSQESRASHTVRRLESSGSVTLEGRGGHRRKIKEVNMVSASVLEILLSSRCLLCSFSLLLLCFSQAFVRSQSLCPSLFGSRS